MKNPLIIDSRLAWPPVVLLVFVCLTVVGFDFVWRTMVISGEALLLCAVFVLLVGCALIAGVARLTRIARR